MNLNESLEFSALYDSMWKCRRGKMWKASVARFVINGVDSTLKLEDELNGGKYKPRKPHTFKLTYPKVRDCSSTHIRDRVVQRSMNDNVIYPAMTSGFVYDNMACQTGKGTTAAMNRLNQFLRRHYINHGREGWVLQCDVKGYYENMRHRDAYLCFRRKLDEETTRLCMSWLEYQYPTDKGYAPGSQMVQILGISMLNPMDHAAKEKAGARSYLRNMDDFLVISTDRAFLEHCRVMFAEELGRLGLWLHPKKTRIYRLTDGIKFLGFTFRLTSTGKVVRIIDPDNVKHERKKLFRMAQLVKAGTMTPEKFRDCYRAWKAHAELGNSYNLLKRMDAYVKNLFKEDAENADHSADRDNCRTAQDG